MLVGGDNVMNKHDIVVQHSIESYACGCLCATRVLDDQVTCYDHISCVIICFNAYGYDALSRHISHKPEKKNYHHQFNAL